MLYISLSSRNHPGLQRSWMDHFCTELGLVSVQPERAGARPAPQARRSCSQQDLRWGTTGDMEG